MATILAGVQSAANIIIGEYKHTIDNWTFQLFYHWSVVQLIGFSIIITSSQMFGDPIVCDLPDGNVNENVLKSYCLMYSTFNIPPSFEGHCARRDIQNDPMFNTYYQWVPLALILQAGTFYIPRVIWLMSEGGLMKYLGKGTRGILIQEGDEKMKNLLATFRYNLENKYNLYTFYFFLCEVLNVAVVFFQIFLTDVFLHNQFASYGIRVLKFYSMPSEESAMNGIINPMCEAFPRIASCTYWRYGSGGRQMSYNALCVLSLNIVIDKIYLWLWFWFVLIGFLGSFRIFSRLIQIGSTEYRFWLMKRKMSQYFKKGDDLNEIRDHIRRCKIGDWFVLYQMSKNLNKEFFYNFLVQLSKEERKSTKECLMMDPLLVTCGGDVQKPSAPLASSAPGALAIAGASSSSRIDSASKKNKRRGDDSDDSDDDHDIPDHLLHMGRKREHIRSDRNARSTLEPPNNKRFDYRGNPRNYRRR